MPPDPYGRRCPLLCISRARPALRVLPSLCRFLQETVTKQLTVLIQTNVPLPTNRKRPRRQERPCGIVSPEKHFSRPEMFHDSSGKPPSDFSCHRFTPETGPPLLPQPASSFAIPHRAAILSRLASTKHHRRTGGKTGERERSSKSPGSVRSSASALRRRGSARRINRTGARGERLGMRPESSSANSRSPRP